MSLNLAGASSAGRIRGGGAPAAGALDLAVPSGFTAAGSVCFLAEACLGQGRNDEALEAARLALSLSRDESPDHLGHAWRVLGLVTARVGPVEIGDDTWPSDASFAEATRVFERAEMDSERARVLYDWGRHDREAGRLEEGERKLEEAGSIFARLGRSLGPEPAARAG